MPRKTVEFNCMELVDAVCLVGHHFDFNYRYDSLIETLTTWNTTIIPPYIKFNHHSDVAQYIADMSTKQRLIQKRMGMFKMLRCNFKKEFTQSDVQCVYISGKINRHPEIDTLNAGLDKKECKADIYIQLQQSFVGWSTKQQKNATKSNYSVLKILGEEMNKKLTKVKSDYLTESGFPTHNKSQRPQVNALFYVDNPFWDAVRQGIEDHKETVKEALVKPLLGINVQYPLYEFDGSSIRHLNNITDESTFKEHPAYYLTKQGVRRNAAKLFYQLIIHKKKYRVEIRWKGNIHSASPQFQIHEDK